MELEVERKLVAESPRVKEYSTVTRYLQDYFLFRKLNQPDFSYEDWALELDFKSKSSLRMMAYGRRNVTERMIDQFSRRENLSPSEKEYFTLLAECQNNKSPEFTTTLMSRMFELSDFNSKTHVVPDAESLLSDPLNAIVQMLVSFEDFEATELNLQKVVGTELSKIRGALTTLRDLGLIKPGPKEPKKDQAWLSNAKFFRIPPETKSEFMRKFQRQTANEIHEIIHKEIIDKKLLSLFFSLSAEDFKDLEDTIDQFANKIKVKYANDFIHQKKIFKMNVSVYPVTEKCD